ncbi:MAG: methionine--tRNA ligase subunit beta, partial [Methanoregulaceae archaeon]
AQKEFGGVPDCPVDPATLTGIETCLASVDAAMQEYDFKTAVDAILLLAGYGNNYIQTSAPWKLVKTDRDAAARVIRNCLQVAHALALLIEPVMPGKAQGIWEMLGNTDRVETHRIDAAIVPIDIRSLPAPKPLFEKIDDTLIASLEALLKKRVEAAEMKAARETIPMITIEDFARMDIRTGKVLAAEAVPKSAKLLKLSVDIGGEARQIVSGIAQFYTPEELVGKEVVVLANLKPAKIFGIESNGMILAAGDAASLLMPLKTVEPGTKIR